MLPVVVVVAVAAVELLDDVAVVWIAAREKEM